MPLETMEAVDILNRLDGDRIKIALDWLRNLEDDEEIETYYDTIMHIKALDEYERGESIDEDEIDRRIEARIKAGE